MRPLGLFSAPTSFKDDLNLELMSKALTTNIKQLRSSHISHLQFGSTFVDKEDYILALEALGKSLALLPSGDHFGDDFYEIIEKNFQFHEIYGQKKWGEVFMTAYYEPVIEGSYSKTRRFSQALYGVPKDMVLVRVDEFRRQFPKLFLVHQKSSKKNKKNKRNFLGRLVSRSQGMPEVHPFYDRKSIDGGKGEALDAPVLAWVEPIEAFFLQIQGSGTVRFQDGEEKLLGYAGQNGHPYVAIGKYLLDVIPIEDMSLQAIKKHLRSLPKDEVQALFYKNPSYVFFQERVGGPVGSFGAEVIPGRTVATDDSLFPKGALAFLEFEKPIFETPQSLRPRSWAKVTRFVFDQDTGGAIRGPHRLDLFWGRGPAAGQAAGVIRRWGRFYYLTPKPEFLKKLKELKKPTSKVNIKNKTYR